MRRPRDWCCVTARRQRAPFDAGRLRGDAAFFHELSPESRRKRFFTAGEPADALVNRLCDRRTTSAASRWSPCGRSARHAADRGRLLLCHTPGAAEAAFRRRRPLSGKVSPHRAARAARRDRGPATAFADSRRRPCRQPRDARSLPRLRIRGAIEIGARVRRGHARPDPIRRRRRLG